MARHCDVNAPMTGAPRIKITYRPVEALVPYARDARQHSDAQIEQIAASLARFGWTVPAIIDGKDGLIAGHGRVLAAQRVWRRGGEIRLAPKGRVPCVVRDDLTKAERHAYVIADNRLAEVAEWDEELLAAEIAALSELDFDFDAVGFDEAQVTAMLDALYEQDADGDEEDDDGGGEERSDEAVSRPGDLWLMDDHRVLCGDACSEHDVARLLDGCKPPTLMITDPPYGVEYDPGWRDTKFTTGGTRSTGIVHNDSRADWREAWRHFPGDVAYVWHGALACAAVQESLMAADFQTRAQIVWAKPQLIVGRGNYHWQHESCWYAVRKGKRANWQGGRKQSTVWNIKSRTGANGEKDDMSTNHGTQKPVECMARPIRNNSLRGDAIYDPFLGSGTTLVAADKLDRVCLGVEIDPGYVDVAIKRWQALSVRAATLAGDGRTFEEVAIERGASWPLRGTDQPAAGDGG